MQGRDSKGAPFTRRRWLLALAAAGLVAALVLSACGSSSKSSTGARIFFTSAAVRFSIGLWKLSWI